MRRTLAASLLLAAAALWGACGGNSNTANTGREDVDTTVNSERIESSNIAPTGGPGPEPESRGAQSSANANAGKNANEGKTDNKAAGNNKNTQ